MTQKTHDFSLPVCDTKYASNDATKCSEVILGSEHHSDTKIVKKQPRRKPRSRSYCFTYNKKISTWQDEPTWAQMPKTFGPNVKYVIYEKEMGESGNEHWQGFCQLYNPISGNSLCRYLGLPSHLHWELPISDLASRNYCHPTDHKLCKEPKKGIIFADTSFEYGVFDAVGQGRRTDVTAMKEDIKKGASLYDIFDKYPDLYFRHNRSIKDALSLAIAKNTRRTWKTHVTVFWNTDPNGGNGKTRKCWDEAGGPENKDVFIMTRNMKGWWDGYRGQPYVIIDDFRIAAWDRDELVTLFDRYPMPVNVKGGSVEWLATHIWISTNEDPETWWDRDAMSQLKRRIERIEKVENYDGNLGVLG